jgi:hypothetical protein
LLWLMGVGFRYNVGKIKVPAFPYIYRYDYSTDSVRNLAVPVLQSA